MNYELLIGMYFITLFLVFTVAIKIPELKLNIKGIKAIIKTSIYMYLLPLSIYLIYKGVT